MMKALRHVLELFQSTHPGLASVKLVTMSLTAFGPWFRCFFGQYDRDKIKKFLLYFFLAKKIEKGYEFFLWSKCKLNRLLEGGRARRESGREASDGPSQFSRCCSLTSCLSKATSSRKETRTFIYRSYRRNLIRLSTRTQQPSSRARTSSRSLSRSLPSLPVTLDWSGLSCLHTLSRARVFTSLVSCSRRS